MGGIPGLYHETTMAAWLRRQEVQAQYAREMQRLHNVSLLTDNQLRCELLRYGNGQAENHQETSMPKTKTDDVSQCQGCGAWGIGKCDYCGNQIKGQT